MFLNRFSLTKLLLILLLLLTVAVVVVVVWGGIHVGMHTARYECDDQRTIFKSWLLPSTVGSRNQTQVVRLAP